jgi:predicted phage tail component-like protein
MPSFSFNGIKKSYVSSGFGGRKRQIYNIKRNLIYIPGYSGAYVESTYDDVKVIEEKIIINAKDRENLQKVKEDLASWLITDEPKTLIFDDEPDRIYFAMVDGSLELDEFVNLGYGTIRFICPDPFKYSTNESYTEFSTAASFAVEGTVETEPIIEVQVKQNTTFVAISDGDKINMVGNYGSVEEQPYEPKERKLWSQCNTLTGWTPSSTVDGGEVSGTLKTDGYYFYTDDYGTGSQWHGPAMKTAFGEQLQDFCLESIIDFRATDPKQVGRIVITVLDDLNQTVARMQFWRRSQYANTNYALFAVGHGANQKTIYHNTGSKPWVWDDFYGMLRIERVENKWNVYIAQINRDTKVHHSRDGVTGWIDSELIAANKISQVLVHVSTFSDYPACTQRIDELFVYKLNQQPEGIPYVANAGDVIVFDHQNENILKNGESVIKHKAFIGDYFKLKPGINSLAAAPEDAIERVKVRWRNKWR